MSERKMGILISYLNIILNTAICFLYVPILLYYIGTSEYGLYQLMGSLIAYFGIMDFGLNASVIRFYTRYKTFNDKIGMQNILALAGYGYCIISIIILIVGAIIYFFIDNIFGNSLTTVELQSAKKIYILLLFNIIITISTMLFRAVINSHEKFLFLKGIETVQIIIQPVAVIAVIQINPTALGIVIVQTILNVILICARGYYCFAKLGIVIKYHYFDNVLFKEIRTFASSVFIVALIDQVFFKANQVILGIISGTLAVAVYSIAALIYMNYMALSTAISSVYLPKVTQMIAKEVSNREVSDLFIRIGRVQYLLLALVLSGFFLFGRDFIKWWAGERFEDAYIIVLLIIIPFTIDLIQNIGICIMQAQNRYGFRAKVYFCVGVLNVVLAVPLAGRYGGIGCACALGGAMFIGNGIVMNWYYYRIIQLDIIDFWKQIWGISICAIFVSIIGFLFNQMIVTTSFVVLIAKIILYWLIYSIVMWRWSMNSYEKNLIIKPLKVLMDKVN